MSTAGNKHVLSVSCLCHTATSTCISTSRQNVSEPDKQTQFPADCQFDFFSLSLSLLSLTLSHSYTCLSHSLSLSLSMSLRALLFVSDLSCLLIKCNFPSYFFFLFWCKAKAKDVEKCENVCELLFLQLNN